MRDLVLELSIQLERLLDRLCDEKACVTPEHAEVRELISRAKDALKNVTVTEVHFDPPQPMTVYVPVPDPREHYWGRRG